MTRPTSPTALPNSDRTHCSRRRGGVRRSPLSVGKRQSVFLHRTMSMQGIAPSLPSGHLGVSGGSIAPSLPGRGLNVGRDPRCIEISVAKVSPGVLAARCRPCRGEGGVR